MAVTRCLYCQTHVQWLRTRFGKRLPFTMPIAISAAAPDNAWIAGTWEASGRKQVLLAPLGHYSKAKQEAVRHVVAVHQCPEYQAARAGELATSR
jgi:hypothetical protein